MSSFKANKNLKADARESLLGNLTTAVAAIFFYTLTTMVLSEMIAGFNTKSLLISLLFSLVVFFVINTCANMLRIGLACIFLKLQFRQKASVGDLFYAFRNNSDAAVMISAFIAALELLCMLPYVVFTSFVSGHNSPVYTAITIFLIGAGVLGTIAVRIRYAICTYLFLDFPDYSASELIRGGTKLISGHLPRLVVLDISFFPLYVLSLISLGVASLWVSSYTHAAEAAFYKDLMANTAF